MPVWRVPYFQDEVLGVERLNALGKALYGSRDPAKRYFNEAPYRFRKIHGGYEARLRLPFVSGKDVDLFKKNDELVIRIGVFKRHISLPQRMMRCEPLGARFENGELIVELGESHAQNKKGLETA